MRNRICTLHAPGSRGRWLIGLASVCLTSLITTAAECPKQAKTEQALVELEHRWAKALEQRDSAVIGCILAPEFRDSGAEGQLHDRRQVLASLPSRKPTLNHLIELHPKLLGEVGMVRGVNRVTDAAGHVLAQVRFTDVFVYREARWQAIAGQETLMREEQQTGENKPDGI